MMPRCAHPLTLLLAVLLWLAPSVHAQQGSVATDTAALQALYNATNGANWTDDTNWGIAPALSSWHGVTTNSDGRVTELELDGNGLSGTLPTELGDLTELASLRLNGNVYLAGPLPAGLRELSALATVDLADTELCAPEDDAFQTWLDAISFSGLICAPTEESVIDVAVFYTPAARDNAGGAAAIEAEIDLMAAETNLAYRASGVNQRLVLAAVEEVEYDEDAGNFGRRLQDPSDGHMDEVHTTRDQVAADIVLLIISGTFGQGGRAYEILTPANASAANAFAWTRLGRGTLIFAHELGHLMGLAHDRWTACAIGQLSADEGCSPAATAYGNGYVNQRAFDAGALTAARWRTIMAFGGQCSNEGRRFRCHELLRFSNPDRIHPDPGGDPMGVPGREPSTAVDGPADAVRTLNRTRATVAKFRTPTAVTVSFGAAAYTAAEGGEAATVTVNLSPAPGRPVSIPLLSVGATGATASDYTAPGSVAFAATETARTFTVTAVDDDADDDGETVALEFDTSLLPSAMTVGNPATATVTLDDDDAVAGAPSVSMVALTSDPGPDAIYAMGDEIEATVRFDKSVTVTGTPQLGLTVGSDVRPATHSGGAGEVLTFSYQVVEGDSDTDGVSIAADSLSGTIQDSANGAAGLTHEAVEDDARHRVDAVRPLLQGAVVDGNVLDLTYDEALLGNISTTEAQFHAPDAFTVTNGDDTPPVVERLSALNGPELRLVLSRPVIHGQEVTVSYTPGAWSIRDAAGTAAAAFADRSATNETPMPFYDTDHDGLIEITTLAQLDAIRHDLYGDGFPTATGAAAYRAAFPLAFPDTDSRLRCGGECLGYELLADLDFFDINGDGQVDTSDDTNGDGRVAADDTPYWTNGAGWEPIATGLIPWGATFEGNRHTIRHLFINRPAADEVGLFGLVGSSFGTGSIRAVGVIEVDVTGNDYVGGLVGDNRGDVTASYATGRVSGNSEVGGLVGQNRGGVTASYATGPVSGDSGVGGLVGENRGDVTAGYATGRVSGDSEVGGLVGQNRGGVTASYATGPVSGDSGVGGLVGENRGDVTAGYATGRVSGDSEVGGLVGRNFGSSTITASYATGRVSGDGEVGGLLGRNFVSSTITASYWDTTTSGQATGSNGQGQTTTQLQAPTDDTGIYADWNVDLDGDGTNDEPWDFGTSSQYPVLGGAMWQEFGQQIRTNPALMATPAPGQVTLTWSEVSSAAYNLYRTSGTTVEIVSENTANRTYVDTGVTAGATYVYQVAAVINGGEASRSPQVSVVVPMPAVTTCSGGMAGTYPCSNVDLMSFLALDDIGGGDANDIWGWTDSSTGKEYAIMGRTNGTSFVDISDPVNPIYLGNLPPHSARGSNWRDIKVYADHAFIVTEAAGSGMQVFDLTQLRMVASPPATFSETAHYPGFLHAHNVVINEDSGFAYATGTNDCGRGLHMIDIRTPTSPTSAGCFSDDGYTHDAQCVNYDGPDNDHQGKEICLNSNEDTLTIVDVTNKAAPVMLSRTGYTGSRYAHQGWLTEDQAYFLLDDELDEKKNPDVTNTRTYMWDVSDLDAPALIGFHDSTTAATDHNQYVKGSYTYQSNYRAGLRILDITDIANGNLTETAFFDVYPGSDSSSLDGTWSNYPGSSGFMVEMP